MIIKYSEFLKESENIQWKPTDPEFYGIEKYKWNGEYLDCHQYVYIGDKNLEKFPFKFGRIYADFDCGNNNLTTLENSPSIIDGGFICSENKLKDLIHGPKIVGGEYLCFLNELTSLEGSPEIINGVFNICNNKLESFKYFPKEVKGRLCIGENPGIRNIENYPLSIIHDIDSNIPDYYRRIYMKMCDIVNKHKEFFIPLLDDKVAFHQQVMRFDPDMIKYYRNTDITIPKKRTII